MIRRFSLGLALKVVLLVWVFELRDGVAVGFKRDQNGTSNNALIPPGPSGICEAAVTKHGYKCLEFDVPTQDGYVLRLARIPEGRTGATGTDKPPVLLQHGVMVDGVSWMVNSPEENLPMILADNGYDVWITNTRGTRFSRKHKSLQTSDPKYWDWCWDVLVTQDLPAVFGFVYEKTGKKKINYVGHSLGTLVMLASLSEGRLSDQLKSVALLSPIAYLSHMTTPLGVLGAKSFVGEIVTRFLGVAEFNPKERAVLNFINSLCNYSGVKCRDQISSFTGKNCCLNSTAEEIFMRNPPQSTSTKNLVHLSQTVRDGTLEKFDYNPMVNKVHYGQQKPPTYNLSNIAVDMPVFMSYGACDALASVRDVEHLLEHFKLHKPNKLSVQFIKEYAHLDFIMASNANDVVYKPLMEFIKLHQQ